MDIINLFNSLKKPTLYETSSLMWSDRYISQQLLAFHLDSTNDIASRTQDKIEKISNLALAQFENQKLCILDLGCGPGLYTQYFAQHGHEVFGIDISGNSIEYASNNATKMQLKINYTCQNYLEMDYENKFDLIVMIYLDFCVLRPNERDELLLRINRALKPGGKFICDIVNNVNIDKKIIPASWECAEHGFWSPDPYVILNKGYHYEEDKVILNQHVVISKNNTIKSYLFWTHYYEKSTFVSLLESHNFTNIITKDNFFEDDGSNWTGNNISFYIAEKQIK